MLLLLLLLCKKQKRKDHPISFSLSLYIALFRIDCKKRRPSRLLALNKGMDIFPIGYPDPHPPLFPPTFFLKKKKYFSKPLFLFDSFFLCPSISIFMCLALSIFEGTVSRDCWTYVHQSSPSGYSLLTS